MVLEAEKFASVFHRILYRAVSRFCAKNKEFRILSLLNKTVDVISSRPRLFQHYHSHQNHYHRHYSCVVNKYTVKVDGMHWSFYSANCRCWKEFNEHNIYGFHSQLIENTLCLRQFTNRLVSLEQIVVCSGNRVAHMHTCCGEKYRLSR